MLGGFTINPVNPSGKWGVQTQIRLEVEHKRSIAGTRK